MAEAIPFNDAIRLDRGFFPSVPLHSQPNVGDGAIAGKNAIFSRYGEVISWRGFSPYNSFGTRLLHNADGKIAGNKTGNIWKQFGNAYFVIGSGDAYIEDFTQKIGVATPQLQLYLNGKLYQGGLPQPSAPELDIASDALGQAIVGQVSGNVSAQLTRIRTVTGAESPTSEVSNIVNPSNGRVRVVFPAALTEQAQDQWGLYLTPHGLGGIGPHLLNRKVSEGEIAPFAYANVAAGPGDGSATTFGGTTAAPTNSRVAAVVLKDAAGTLPSFVNSSFSVTPGSSPSIRVQRPVGAVDGQFLTVMVTFKASHTVTPSGNNLGTDRISQATGVWMDAPFPLDPRGEKIDVKQDTATTFQWKLRSAGSYSASIPLSTSPTQLGATGISIAWTAASTSILEIGNEFTIDIFALVAPAALPLIDWQNNSSSLIGIGVFGGVLSAASGEFFEWTASQNSQMNALAVAWKDVDTSTPVTQSWSSAHLAATSHTTTLMAGSPTATQLVTLWFTSDGQTADFTPTSPMVQITDTNLLPRFLDITYVDDDLLDIEAPKGFEGPPAATHGFGLSVYAVLVGALDGTAVCPSRPNQPEQFDLNDAVALVPPEPPVRVETSPWDGSIFVWTRNSLQTAVNTGEDQQPILMRTLWSSTGIENQSAACISKKGIYCFSGKRGIARYRGNLEPETDFADAVSEYVEHWNPKNVVTGYIPGLEAIAFCHGNEMLLYFEGQGCWSAVLDILLWNKSTDVGGGVTVGPPFTPRARIVGGLTLDGRWLMVIQDGEDWQNYYEIFTFDVGLGGSWFLRSVARNGNIAGKNKTIREARLIADLSSNQRMEWYNESSLHEETGILRQDATTVEGYAASRLLLPASVIIDGKIRFEWTITTNVAAEMYATFAIKDALAKHGSPPRLPLTQYNLSSKLGWRISPGNLLAFYQGGSGTVQGTILDGDIIRIDFTGNGMVQAEWRRNGALVLPAFPFAYVPGSWNSWHGWKVSIKGGGQVEVGKVSRYEQTGGFRLYKNFGGERGNSAIAEKTYTEDKTKTYKWERLMKTNIVTYNGEVFGSCGSQRASVLYLDGYAPGATHESLKTQ